MTFLQKAALFIPAILAACAAPSPETIPPPRQFDQGAAAATPPPLPALQPPASPAIAPKVTPPPTAAPSPKHPLKVRTASLNGTEFTAVTFDRRDYFLKVIDQKNGPGSQFSSAQAAASGGLAAINGGFFSPEGKPVGLVITGGEVRGSLNTSSSLGTGILDGKSVTLATRQNYQNSSELLQTGPRLVWAGESLTGLSTTNDRPRSFMIWDGQNHFGLAYADSATLKGLSNNLKAQPLSGFDIKYAVNLDGGTSCDLWVSDSVPGGSLSRSSFFRKKARNYLVLKSR